MKKESRRDINLPEPARSWNELSVEQLQYICKLRGQNKMNEASYKLHVFLNLSGLKVLKHAEKKDDGSFIYHLRRKGFRHWLLREKLSVEAWEIDYWINTYLQFLDHPEELTRLPFSDWKFRGKRFKAPNVLMLDVTYEQYSNAQNYLMAYTQQNKLVESMLNNGSSLKAIRRIQEEIVDARSGFLSHLFVAPQWQFTDNDSHSTRLNIHRSYRYSNQSAERHKHYFRTAPEYLFVIMVQFFEGCLHHFSQELPDLFKEGDKQQDKSLWLMEVDTVNAIQKYQGYGAQQDVYDSEVVFIFGILNDMIQQANEIKRIGKR